MFHAITHSTHTAAAIHIHSSGGSVIPMECAMVKLNSLSLPHGGNKIQYPMFFKNFKTPIKLWAAYQVKITKRICPMIKIPVMPATLKKKTKKTVTFHILAQLLRTPLYLGFPFFCKSYPQQHFRCLSRIQNGYSHFKKQ